MEEGIKTKVVHILTLLLIYIIINNSQIFASEKKGLDFTQLIQALSTQLKELQNEIKKEDAVIKLKECTIEIKWIWKYEGGAKVKAFLVEGGGKYGKDEINSFRTVWEPIGDIYASNDNLETLSSKLAELADKLEFRDNDISGLKSALFRTLHASSSYYAGLRRSQFVAGNETPQDIHAKSLWDISSLPVFADISLMTRLSIKLNMPEYVLEQLIKKHKKECDKCSQMQDKDIIQSLDSGFLPEQSQGCTNLLEEVYSWPSSP